MKIPAFLLILLTYLLIGCDGGAPAANNSNSGPPRTVTPVNTPQNAPGDPPDPRLSNSMADSNTMPTKGLPSNGSTNKPANSAAPKTTPTPTTDPPPASTGKKVEGLFSFPPPRALDEFEVPFAQLANREAPTTFADVSRRLSTALEKGGYHSGKYKYFWNTENEFALVTAMERIDIEGKPITTADRFVVSAMLPAAKLWDGHYFSYLIRGKKEFFRVLVFIVTKKEQSFTDPEASSPTFEMAAKWKDHQTRLASKRLGGGTDQAILEIPYDNQYHCSALLYLFVNHTSLDGPTAATELKDGTVHLMAGLNKDAKSNLEVTKISFGE